MDAGRPHFSSSIFECKWNSPGAGATNVLVDVEYRIGAEMKHLIRADNPLLLEGPFTPDGLIGPFPLVPPSEILGFAGDKKRKWVEFGETPGFGNLFKMSKEGNIYVAFRSFTPGVCVRDQRLSQMSSN